MKQAIVSTAASPPAASREEILAQPEYKTSWEQFQALRAKAHPPANPLPDWNGGVWANEFQFQFEPGYPYEKRTPAPLKPKYAAQYAHLMDRADKGEEFDTLGDCIPAGYPRMLIESHMEIVTTPNQVWFMGAMFNETHRVYTDGRGRLSAEDAYPMWEGHSIGFWDGDTLIVHTDSLQGMAMSYQRNGPPLSAKASGVEQWRMIDHDHIALQITIYDPVVMTKPWRPDVRTYVRLKPPNVPELDYYSCSTSSPVTQAASGETQIILPGEPGYIDRNSAQQRHGLEIPEE
jgi:hypothetical protein